LLGLKLIDDGKAGKVEGKLKVGDKAPNSIVLDMTGRQTALEAMGLTARCY